VSAACLAVAGALALAVAVLGFAAGQQQTTPSQSPAAEGDHAPRADAADQALRVRCARPAHQRANPPGARRSPPSAGGLLNPRRCAAPTCGAPGGSGAGRWYPSVVTLADGRAVIMSGLDESGDGRNNDDVEVFTPSPDPDGVGTVTVQESARRGTTYHPHVRTVPGGDVLLAGPGRDDSALLDPGTWT